MKLKSVLAGALAACIVSLGTSTLSNATEAECFPISKVEASIIEKGTEIFGVPPSVNLFTGGQEELSKKLVQSYTDASADDLEKLRVSDTLRVLSYPHQPTFFLYSEGDCARAVVKFPSDTSDKILSILNGFKKTNG